MYTLLRLLFYTSGFSINLYRISTPVLPFLLKWFAYIKLQSGVEKKRTPVLLPYSRKKIASCSTQGGASALPDWHRYHSGAPCVYELIILKSIEPRRTASGAVVLPSSDRRTANPLLYRNPRGGLKNQRQAIEYLLAKSLIYA
jgi:hypothetical protein